MNKILALLFVAAVLIQVNAKPGPEDSANDTPSTPEKSKGDGRKADTTPATGNQKSNPIDEIGRQAQGFAPMMKKAVDVIPQAILSFNDRLFY